MSILIKGMEMPETGAYVFGVDNIKERDVTVTVWKEDEHGLFCPVGIYKAVPVPPHGRLIDADALRYCVDDSAMIAFDYVTRSQINAAPTIIPAEEGE